MLLMKLNPEMPSPTTIQMIPSLRENSQFHLALLGDLFHDAIPASDVLPDFTIGD
jgi:hypothetical protein